MSATAAPVAPSIKKVLVTGAAGKTGRIVLQKLQKLSGE